jgi:hypothetical protein
MSFNTTDIDRGMAHVVTQSEIAKRGAFIETGVFAGQNAGGQSIAHYAAFSEHGSIGAVVFGYHTPKGTRPFSGKEHVPQRSFIRSTVDEQRKKYEEIEAAGVNQIIEGHMTVSGVLSRIGITMVADIKKKIKSNVPPPNAPATLARKRGSITLTNTGALANAIMFKENSGTPAEQQ